MLQLFWTGRPSCSVVANNSDVYTNQTNITLTLSSTDNYGVLGNAF